MNKYAIEHVAKSNYAYIVGPNTVHIKIKCEKNDVEKIEIVYGDKYHWDDNKTTTMKKRFSDDLYDYWDALVSESSGRLSYYFNLYSGSEKLTYTEKGFVDKVDSDLHIYVFNYPFVSDAEYHHAPEWVKDAICYQIFPDRFYNGSKDNDPKNVVPWDSTPTIRNLFGGDLIGIYEKLDYLYDLGVNTIYMTPIFLSDSNHKYDTIDYYNIDPMFGTKEEFKKLVDKAHSLNMRIVLDAVFNHSGVDFLPFKDVREKGEASKYKDWYFIDSYPVEPEKLVKLYEKKGYYKWYMENGKNVLNYKTFAFTPKMPKLNTGNPEVVDYFVEVGKYWIKEFGIDGWRLDVSNEVDHNFWRKFREGVRSIKSDCYIVGEIWHDARPWLLGDQYDGVMNYGITLLAERYFAREEITPLEFKNGVSKIYFTGTKQVNYSMLNLLDSHDTARFINKSKFNKNKLKAALAFIFSYVGMPMVYYGTEIGLTGEHDPDCRKSFNWNEEEWDMELYTFTKELIKLRKEEDLLRSGEFELIENEKYTHIKRYSEDVEDEIHILLKNSEDIEIDKSEFSNMKEIFSVGNGWGYIFKK